MDEKGKREKKNKGEIRKLLTKDQVLTIPNALSLFRLLLIPAIIYIYIARRDYSLAVIFVVISAISDILDGIIARRFNMVSALGKFLDPVADKLTQLSLLICLFTRYTSIWILMVIMVVKETLMLVLGGVTFRKKRDVHGAKWYGKLCTVVMECTLIALMLFPGLSPQTVNVLVMCSAAFMVFSLVMYVIFYVRILSGGRSDKDGF